MSRIPDGSRETDHVDMMRSPDLWPHGFYLPLSRAFDPDAMEPFDDCGVLISAPGVPKLRVYSRVNIVFHRKLIHEIAKGTADLTEVPAKDYPDYEAIRDDGWRVD